MKATGIVRKLDELGRITLPIELRRQFSLNIKDPIEIFVNDDSIVLKKYEPSDIFTGTFEDLKEFHGMKVSKESVLAMNKLFGIEVVNK